MITRIIFHCHRCGTTFSHSFLCETPKNPKVIYLSCSQHFFLSALLKKFAFLLCSVVCAYVMIFQFEIKHKSSFGSEYFYLLNSKRQDFFIWGGGVQFWHLYWQPLFVRFLLNLLLDFRKKSWRDGTSAPPQLPCKIKFRMH